MRPTRPSGRTRLLLGALLVCAVAAALFPAGAEPALRRVGTIPLERTGRVVVDGAARRLIEISGGSTPLTIKVFDGQRYSLLRKVQLEQHLPQALLPVQVLHEAARRLYILAYTSATDMDNRVNAHLLTIDADDLRLLADRPLTVFPPGARTLGFGMVGSGRLALVGQLTAQVAAPFLPPLGAPGTLGVLVAQMDPDTGETVWGPHPARACESPIATHDQTAVAVVDGAFFVACKTPDLIGFSLPGIPSVVAVDVADPTQQSVYFMPGSYGLGESYHDANAHRLVLVGAAFAQPAPAVWVFDLAHRVFLGQTTPGDVGVLGAGVNTDTGRLYVSVERALLVSTDRGLEIPQPLQLDLDPFFGPLIPIPFNRRIIIPIRVPKNDTPVFTVFEDNLPSSLFPPVAPVDYRRFDRLATDTPQFAGDAQAYGFRAHEMGGFNALVQNVFPQPNVNYWSPVTRFTGLKDGDRDLYFGRVAGAHLSPDEATAAAIPADGDANTRADYKTVAAGAGAPQEWPFETAACGDFGGGATSADKAGATSVCHLAGGRSAASATHGAIEIPGVASVGASASTATIRLDRKLGLVSDVHAEARNVTLGPSVEIGYVASDVRVSALGTRGSARADYRRTFRNVSTPGFSCEEDCNPSEVLSAISGQLGLQFRVEMPGVSVVRTPGGAHGHALREPWEHQQDVVLSNQDPTELQVPALRVTFIADSAVASRLLLEFAATKADVTYIRLVSGGGSGSDTAGGRSVDARRTVRVDADSRPVAAPPDNGLVQRLVEVPGRAWKVLFVGGARSAAVWALFAIPIYFAARRRYLIRLFRTRA